jgi:hypothetical protein
MKLLAAISFSMLATTGLAFAGSSNLNGTYKCHLGSYADGGKWTFLHENMAITDGEGELKLKIGDLVAKARSNAYTGTLSVEIAYNGLRSSGSTAVGNGSISADLIIDNAALNIPTSQFWCDQFKPVK